MSETNRTPGIDRATRIIEKIVGREQCSNPRFFIEQLSRMDFSEFVEWLNRFNGIIRGIPKSARRFDPLPTPVERGEMGMIEYQAPEKIDSIRLLKTVFVALREMAGESEPDAETQQRIARSVYNAVTYLHLFADGNGRTARLAYGLLSDDLPRDSTFSASLHFTLMQRPTELNEYHERLDDAVYAALLERRGISATSDPMSSDTRPIASLNSYTDISMNGFDGRCLGYLAAFDAMSPAQRQEFGDEFFDGVRVYLLDDLPESIQDSVYTQLPRIRAEFAERLLEASLSGIGWPQECSQLMRRAFTSESPNALADATHRNL